jgi:TonB family protein
MKEVQMSKTKSISVLAAGLAVLALAGVAPFPLTAAPQMVADGPGVTVDTGGAMLHRGNIMYPDSARAKRVQGVVVVEATLDTSGNVVDTRVLSGPIELRRAAQQSVLQWHFAMDSSMNTRQVKVTFDPSALPEVSPVPQVQSAGKMDAANRAVAEEKIRALRSQITDQTQQVQDPATRQQAMAKLAELQANMNALQSRLGPPSAEGKRLTRVVTNGLTESVRNDLLSRLPVHEGDTLSADSLEGVRKAIREFDEHMNLGTAFNANGEVTLMVSVPGAASGGMIGVSSAVAVPPPADGTKRITIGGNVQQAKLIMQPRPVYPPLAKQARISGVVHLNAIIGKEGNVVNLSVISGHPLLIPSALEAVQQWVYQKTLLNGEPVEVSTQIDVNYTLSDSPVQQ